MRPSRTPVQPPADETQISAAQLDKYLRRIAEVLSPQLSSLDRVLRRRFSKLKFGGPQSEALSSILITSAARLILNGSHATDFFAQVREAGGRLARLNVAPQDIVTALDECSAIVAPSLTGSPNREAMQQIRFCTILTLNEAFFEVREWETRAFHDVFAIEHDCRDLDTLFERFLAITVEIFHASAGRIFPFNGDRPGHAVNHGSGVFTAPKLTPGIQTLLSEVIDCLPAHPKAVLEPSWRKKYAACWSFPLSSERQSGVLQLAFKERTGWLPREEELLEALIERCLLTADRVSLLANLEQREQQLRKLAEHMLQVEEIERTRISRELHDEAGQSLVCIRLQMELIEMALPPEGSEWRTKLAEARDLTEKTILDMRRLIADLSPIILEQFGLEAAIRQLAKRLHGVADCQVVVKLVNLRPSESKIETLVYRIAQECCTNIRKHSLATRVNISVISADRVLSLEVRDNGVGFEVESALAKPDSFGLAGIRERVALFGGKSEIVSRPSSANKRIRGWASGTEIRITLPLPPSRSATPTKNSL